MSERDPNVIDVPTTALARRESVLLMPVMDVATALARLKEFQAFCAQYLYESADGGQDGGDFGVIPGTKKKTLLKSGAEKLCEIYGLADEYVIINQVENWETGLFAYTIRCILKSRRDDSVVGEGLGSCSSYESKYRWREQQKTCPQCGIAAIIKGKQQFGGGWLCWNKKGGCGAKFLDGDQVIEQQPVGRVENPDIIDTMNTVLKMSKKRAKVDAVIGVTRSSGIFTQDEDLIGIPANAVAKAAQEAEPATPATSSDVSGSKMGWAAAVITEAQAKRFHAIARTAGWNPDDLKRWLLATYGLASSRAIPRDRYDAIIGEVQRGVVAAVGDDNSPADPMLKAEDVF